MESITIFGGVKAVADNCSCGVSIRKEGVINMADDLYYELPNATTNPAEILFALPNQYTGGLFINIWLAGLYGVLLIGATRFGQNIQAGSLFASFGTFIVTFLLVLLSGFISTPIAGGNQLIPVTMLLAGNLLWNYMSGKGGVSL